MPPPSSSAATTSSRRFACQSWLPSTARTGTPSSGRTAAATMAACSGSPCVVRSPASSTRSTWSRSPAKASVQRSWSPSRPRWMSPVAAIRIAQRSRAARPASFSERMAMLRRVPGYDAPYVRGRRAAVLRHRGDAEEVRGGAARGRRPVPARREPRVVGARRPGDAPRPRPDDQARGRRPRARRRSSTPACAPRTRPRSGSSRPGTATCSSTSSSGPRACRSTTT